MDVPISIGVLLAFGMSLYDTIHGGRHAYFDASITLLFFLLIGRTLDHVMREKARVAVTGLAQLAPRGALVVRTDGAHEYLPVAKIAPGMTILVAAGERVPVNGRVESGTSDLDCSLVTGESIPRPVEAGATLQAGTLNLTGPLTIKAIDAARDSFLAEMIRLMEAAEAIRSDYRRIADRAARLYAPIVHAAALLSFVGWMAAAADIHQAMTIAVAVLIITCPCALGLAVPIVQVVAARRLFENGIMVKDGSAMERLGEIDTVVFDKTGTLTLGWPNLSSSDGIDPENLALAAAMAAHSRHPYSQAVVAAAASHARMRIVFDSISERPGYGLEAKSGADVFRLGRATWALDRTESFQAGSGESETVLSKNGRRLETFLFHDRVRPGAREAIAQLTTQGVAIEVLSGDRAPHGPRLANDLGIASFDAGVLPEEKAARLASLAAAGRRALMVGDGLNDAPALAAAHVSMAPATAADVGRNAADFVFLRESLDAVPYAIALSRDAGRLIRQNLGLAVVYNAIALPFAVLGFVTPLVAAAAMSSSSILVVANALRLTGGKRRRCRARPKMREPALAMDPAE
jgi:Cu2+-exporting ATPase